MRLAAARTETELSWCGTLLALSEGLWALLGVRRNHRLALRLDSLAVAGLAINLITRLSTTAFAAIKLRIAFDFAPILAAASIVPSTLPLI